MESFSSDDGLPTHLTDSGRRLGYETRRRQQAKCMDFKYAIPLVLVLLTMKYQGKPQTPFDTHPILITISLIAMLVSFIASATRLPAGISGNTRRIIRDIRELSGALALALLGSLLVSHTLFWSAYLVCIYPLARSLFHFFNYLRQLLPQTATTDFILTMLRRLITICTPNEPQLPTPSITV